MRPPVIRGVAAAPRDGSPPPVRAVAEGRLIEALDDSRTESAVVASPSTPIIGRAPLFFCDRGNAGAAHQVGIQYLHSAQENNYLLL